MPVDSIFTSCRKGDLKSIKHLVEKKEIDLNVRDCWDSTPLYYACHCGHHKVVEYLLANGARCEPNTFDGERCLYGALTDDIKKLLIDSKLVKASSKKRDDFDEFCERMLRAEEFSDISLFIGQQEFKLHRCILSMRSPYFKSKLQGAWKNGVGRIRTEAVQPNVFGDFINFVYTGRTQVDRQDFQDSWALGDKCKVGNFTELLIKARIEAEYFELAKGRAKISTLIIDKPQTHTDLVNDFETMVSPGIPDIFYSVWPCACVPGSLIEDEEFVVDPLYDICLKVDDHRFYCNKVFLCCRSEYFYALIRDHFHEIDQRSQVPVIVMHNVTPPIIASVLHYIYTNETIPPGPNDIVNLIEAAELYLLPGLKRSCGSFLYDVIERDNVIDTLLMARLFDLSKLETLCAKFISENINVMAQDDEFISLVCSDARAVTHREDTDSIDIIDDVRYHITSGIASFSEVEDAETKLKIIDELLESLGLDA